MRRLIMHVREIPDVVMNTLEVYYPEFGHSEKDSVVVNPRGVLKIEGKTPEEYLEVLFARFKQMPQPFVKGLFKLLKYHNEGKKVYLNFRPAWYGAAVRVFYKALAEFVVEGCVEYQKSQDQLKIVKELNSSIEGVSYSKQVGLE
jgi:hypothetical protein